MEGKLATSRPRTAQPPPACCRCCHNNHKRWRQQVEAITRPFALICSSIADIHFNLQRKSQLSSSTMGKTAGHTHTPKIPPSRLMALTDISPEGV